MKYEVGQWLIWVQEIGGQTHTYAVQVDSLRKRGGAKLSNGWVVDADGYADGTSRMPGGFVMEYSSDLYGSLEKQTDDHPVLIAVDDDGVVLEICLPGMEWTPRWRIEQFDLGRSIEETTISKALEALHAGPKFH